MLPVQNLEKLWTEAQHQLNSQQQQIESLEADIREKEALLNAWTKKVGYRNLVGVAITDIEITAACRIIDIVGNL